MVFKREIGNGSSKFGCPSTHYGHVIVIWVFNKWLKLMTVAVVCGQGITICDLPCWFPRTKSIEKLAGKVSSCFSTLLVPFPTSQQPPLALLCLCNGMCVTCLLVCLQAIWDLLNDPPSLLRNCNREYLDCPC